MILTEHYNKSMSSWILSLFQKCYVILAILVIYKNTSGSNLALASRIVWSREREKYPTLEEKYAFTERRKEYISIKHTQVE